PAPSQGDAEAGQEHPGRALSPDDRRAVHRRRPGAGEVSGPPRASEKRNMRTRRNSDRGIAEPLEPRTHLAAFRPPAVPLLVNDPFLSVWSEANNLTDDVTREWTGAAQPLVSLIKIDGQTYRLMGSQPTDSPGTIPAFPQTGVQVTPTRSIYDFDDGHLHVTMTFMTPALPSNLDVLTRPLTYINWDVRIVDNQSHDVSIYESSSSLLSVTSNTHTVT